MSPNQHDQERDRRSGTDRRVFSYAVHIPERRKNGERRRHQRKPRKHLQESLQIADPAPAWKAPFAI